MPAGYWGKILRVDLTARKTSVEEPEEAQYRKYIGGSAMAAYYLIREIRPGIDPLGPENVFVVMASPTCGTPLSGANRYTVAAKSPLTGGYGESEAGGYFGPELKAAGYDGIIITGRSASPVYLYVKDGAAELRDASKFWGKVSGDVQDGIVAECEKGTRVLQTGIAGENLVRYAALTNECRHYHGRTGLGAVLGSKKLKAIAVRGRGKVTVKNEAGAKAVRDWFKEVYKPQEDGLHLLGTARLVAILDEQGILPTRNFRQGSLENARNISGSAMAETILKKRATCYACAVACKREVSVPELGVIPKYGGPEYETLAAMGSLLGISNLKSIALYNQLLNQYVLDSISTGAVIAFAMECFENGILTVEDTGGIELRFGNEEAVTKLVPMIARREGFGTLLAEGVKRASERIGPESAQYAMHVKGQELPMHEPRGKRSLALAYATSPTGADHVEAPHDAFFEKPGRTAQLMGITEPVASLDFGPKKVETFYKAQKLWSIYNVVGMCNFVGAPIGKLDIDKLLEYCNAVTGWDMDLGELIRVAQRSETLMRLFNCREGRSAADDTLPRRMFEPLENGVLKGVAISQEQFREALRQYYELMGWDAEMGFPARRTIEELGLEWAV
jgi:aldehyde:ferredoxin oxidoreductase